LVEEFWRPAIVLSEGRKISKASARSISGFNIIESIRKLDGLILGGGGHPMAAGFSIETDKVKTFKEKFDDLTAPLLTNDVLKRKIKIDMEIGFANISETLIKELERFEPSGNGNPMPLFVTKNIKFVSARTVGADGKHLKLALEGSGFVYNAIAFAMGEYYLKLKPGSKRDIVYSLVQNTWNNKSDLQLKIKDLKIRNETAGV
jgi:single-stranded-DNA-specific exonuclease